MSAKKRTVSGALGGFLGFVGMSVVAGVLVTAAVTPALAVSGMAATNTINVFETLPEYLSIDQLAQKSNIWASADVNDPQGSRVLLASFYQQNRVEVAFDQISDYAKDAAIYGEDPRFYEHGGIDLQGTSRAAIGLLAPGVGSGGGGSSITQQYVKNVLVQKCEELSDATERMDCYTDATIETVDRKLKEMRLAIGVEKNYDKDEILRGYLNIAGYGGTVYGIESAANYYFNTTAANLTLPQAASLIATVNNPVRYQLDKPDSETNGAANGYANNKERRDYILGEMLEYQSITQEEHDAAVASVIEPTITAPSTGCQTAGANAYFCDYVTKILLNDETFGADAEERLAAFRQGGYDVYTSIDLQLQDAAVATMAENVPQTYRNWDVGAVISSVEVGTGRVLAMTQNKEYSQDPTLASSGTPYTSINYNTDQNYGGSVGFQPGSTYKVFTLAQWLNEGHSLNERVDSRRKANWGTFQDSCLGPQTFSGFNPRNDANEAGANYSALQSTLGSINTGFIGMAKELDLCGIRQTAEAFGVHRADGDDLQQGASAVLGTNEIAPLSMAVAFAGIANNGETHSAIAIDRIIGADGVDLPVPESKVTQSVEPEVAAGMTYAMQRVMTAGTATQSNGSTFPKVPMIGKTGTTDASKDTWMTGATSKVATVAGVVNVSGTARSQRNTSFSSGSAATARHRMWPDVMSVANTNYGGEAFAEPTNAAVQGVQVTVPDLRGQSMSSAQSTLEAAGFDFTDGGVVDSELPTGTVASTDPAGGSSVSRGTRVTVQSSNGTGVVIPEVVNQTEAAARAALSAAPYGFTIAKREQDVTDPNQVGKVIGVEPGTGTAARPGDTVTIVVGKLAASAAPSNNGNGNGNGNNNNGG
ncbi:PASTA domain-containing protein [Cryobacterium melibiosiphilum]|uniref:PASTA domain-containing protein n=1 Tax=Cryobacterium melibiosiphilum TaxID=995039 RepID=A0A3A5MRT9_9MICO|nr:transglycosylase domain-containing protein [Cryobacterium melibiosiphilum]RJT92042.1 PASTA domain-containing protein [Cryobacterium melibiosiphilum]